MPGRTRRKPHPDPIPLTRRVFSGSTRKPHRATRSRAHNAFTLTEVVLATALLAAGILTLLALLIPASRPTAEAGRGQALQGLTLAVTADLRTSSRDRALTQSCLFAIPLQILTDPQTTHTLHLTRDWQPAPNPRDEPDAGTPAFTVHIEPQRIPATDSLLPAELLITTRDPGGARHAQLIAITRPAP